MLTVKTTKISSENLDGPGVLKVVLGLAEASLREMFCHARSPDGRFAAVGHLRGTGPGVSFSGAVRNLEAQYPLELVSPFEGSERIGGAAWAASDLLNPFDDRGIAKLRWGPHADDLPMHAHTASDRFIVVLEGRGFFHVSDKTVDDFDGTDVRTIAARRLDVFAFTRDVVHTFSTAAEPMTLLSCHLPFIPLDAPDQYDLPSVRWIARDRLRREESSLVVSGWSLLAG